jgi:hypothetical protein
MQQGVSCKRADGEGDQQLQQPVEAPLSAVAHHRNNGHRDKTDETDDSYR